MSFKKFFGFLFILIVLFLLAFYWFSPFSEGESFAFPSQDSASNFSLYGNSNLQFYENMRFQNPSISYRIDDCTLQKKDDMTRAFEIVGEKTILDFYPVGSNEEIYVSCSEKNKVEGGLFVAGEGGPTNITQAGDFNVIFNGEISLLRDSKCPSPNVGMHELFHVLGFNHSENSKNIMYPVNKCDQEISDDMIELIDELYSIPSRPDLVFEDISAEISGRSLNTKFTVRNFGLADSEEFKVAIYVNGDLKPTKEVEMKSIAVGYGRTITLENVFISQFNVNELELSIDSSFQELNKENNKINLEIKGA